MSVKSIMETLLEFLKQYKIPFSEKGAPFTHTTKTAPDFPSGSYKIPTEELDNFYTHYSNAVHKGGTLSVTEKPGPYGPLRVDFDLKASSEVSLIRQYDEKILKAIVGYYQSEIKAVVPPKHFTDELLTCIVLEKQAPRILDGKVCDGFHFHFPNFICDAHMQDKYLRDKVTLKMVENKIWSRAKFLTKIDDLIDRDMGNKPWMMYGSMNYKGAKSTPYMYNRRQPNERIENDPWRNTPHDEQWGHIYDHNLAEIQMSSVFATDMIGRVKSVKYYLPRFMSIRGHTRPTKLIDSIEQRLAIAGVVKRKPRKIIKLRSIEDVLADIQTIKEAQFMDMLSLDRADNHDSWMDVGWTLFCIGQGHEECLKLWIDFSQKSAEFEPGKCEERWDSMEVKGKTIGSLIAMAKHDDPIMFKDWITTNVNTYILKSTHEPKPTEYDIAMVAVAKYKGQFCCADATKNIWYEFRDHRWYRMEDTIALKTQIIENIMDAYKAYKAVIANKQMGMDNEESAKLQLQEKRILAIITALKSIRFVEAVVKFCKIKMHDSTFHKKMNENKDLFCCENGVLDLENCTFRDGRPDDYCTLSCGLNYQTFNEDDDEVQETDLFVRKVFPNHNIHNYFMDMGTACLQGGNPNKRFIIATGASNGGKSVTFKLLGLVYGDYMGKFPRQLLLKGNGVSSGQARPELALVRGKRIMSTQEITHMDNLDIGTLKELTGNDSFFTRGMYDSGGDINPQFTLFMQCNDPPNIPGSDEATWSRLRIIDCESKFVIKSDLDVYPVAETEEEQFEQKRFHADTKIGNKLDYMAPVLLWRFFTNFAKYKKHGLKEPKEVTTSTNAYKNRSDIYLEFIQAHVETEEDDDAARNTSMKLVDVFAEFTEWYKESYPAYYLKDKIGKPKLKTELTRRLGVIHDKKKDIRGFGDQNRWWGYRLVQEEDKVGDTKLMLTQ